MPEVLMINPRRRKSRKASAKVSKRRARRRNPIAAKSLSSVARKANPSRRPIRRARRRNPIGSASMNSLMAMMTDVAIQTAGSVGVNLAFGAIQSKLPASLQPNPTAVVDAYDAAKMVVTLAAGFLLSKPTKGYSRKMAVGALTTQLSNIAELAIEKNAPSVKLGYATPNKVVRLNSRLGQGQLNGQYLRSQSTLDGRRVRHGSTLNGVNVPQPNIERLNAGFAVR